MNPEEIGLKVPKILLPELDIDMTKWAVVACDQFTSQPEYWQEANRIVGAEPSTLRMILPEAHLESPNLGRRFKRIQQNMVKYSEEVLTRKVQGMIHVQRINGNISPRNGLVIALDLDKYDYNNGSTKLIRATEETIPDRLTSRINIRSDATLEVPHILILIDDPERKIIEPLVSKNNKTLYDFPLMLSNERIRGKLIEDNKTIDDIIRKLSRLAQPEVFRSRYKTNSDYVMLYAAGDGNHSLATAKTIWDALKIAGNENYPLGISGHPARYALVELVNIHDKGLIFEPIHRIVFDTRHEELMRYFTTVKGDFSKVTYSPISANKARDSFFQTGKKDMHHILYVTSEGYGVLTIHNPGHVLEIGSLQYLLDQFQTDNPKARIDYIHGDDVVSNLGSIDGNIGFFLPHIRKENLFETIIKNGVLPKKAYSLGHAEQKRYYLECRKIVR